MAIVINGSGTVTGISVGGLPDGIVDAGTLATNSVDSAELIDGSIDNSHIDAMAASKLTGALPAISGASLTGLTSSQMPAGTILQVVENTVTSTIATYSDSYYTMYSAAITPSSTSSRIVVLAFVGSMYTNLGSNVAQFNWKIDRAGSAVTGHNTHFHAEVGRGETDIGTRGFVNMGIVDEPSTTSSVQYNVQAIRHNGTGGVQINDTSGTSSIILMEIGG
jgi:hypothetical protein